MKVGERVKLINEYKSGTILIPQNHICTIISALDDSSVFVRYNSDKDKNYFAGVPKESIISVTHEDLEKLNKNILVSKTYHLYNPFVVENDIGNFVKKDEIVKIIDIVINLNENDDIFKFSKNEDEVFYLRKDQVDFYLTPYISTFHDNLGEEIDLKNAPRNYFVEGAKVLDKTNKIVFIQQVIGKEDYLIEDENGLTSSRNSNELTLIRNYQELLSYDNFEHVDFKSGTKYCAKENIEHNALLSENIKYNDVIEIIRLNYQSINFYEDIYLVKLPIGKTIELSVFEIKMHFEKINGMYKNTSTKSYVSSVDVIEEGLKFLDPNYINKIDDYLNENIQPGKQPEIKINSLTVNGYTFNLVDNERIKVESNISIEDAQDFIKAFQEAIKFIQKR